MENEIIKNLEEDHEFWPTNNENKIKQDIC